LPGDATSAADDIRPRVFAGFPVSSWAFALRVLLAMLLALYVSFWLELESPSSAAVTVAILALPTRAQGMEKAGYRLLATAIGVIASIAAITPRHRRNSVTLIKTSAATRKRSRLTRKRFD